MYINIGAIFDMMAMQLTLIEAIRLGNT